MYTKVELKMSLKRADETHTIIKVSLMSETVCQ
jgi:hypothetical protein